MHGLTLRHKAPTVRFKPNSAKIVESILFLISDAAARTLSITQYDIVKALFLADKAHLNKYGRPITFDNYYAMKNGPVPTNAYDLLKGNKRLKETFGIDEFPWDSQPAPEISKTARIYKSAKRKPSEDILSPSDMEALSSALSTVSSLTFRQIMRLTHDDPAYEDAWGADDSKSSYPMSVGLLFDVPDFERAEELEFISKHT